MICVSFVASIPLSERWAILERNLYIISLLKHCYYTCYLELYIYIYIYIYIYTVKPLYKKLFFFSTFVLIERFSYREVFTFPMILRINL